MLDDSTLSYYYSKDEVDCGSRGAYRVTAALRVDVDRQDTTRFDLCFQPTIATLDQTQLYLKAPTTQLRQQWISALHLAKIADANTTSLASSALPPPPDSTAAARRDSLEEARRGNLRNQRRQLDFYREQLDQVVDRLRSGIETRDAVRVEQSWSEIGPLSDCFASTVSECVRAIDECSPFSPPILEPTTLLINSSPPDSVEKQPLTNRRSSSSDPYEDVPKVTVRRLSATSAPSLSNELTVSVAPSPIEEGKENCSSARSSPGEYDEFSDAVDHEKRDIGPVERDSETRNNDEKMSTTRCSTLFSSARVTFYDAIVVASPTDCIEPNSVAIDTRLFLEACDPIISILDLLGKTAFYPVKRDIMGNINKIRARFETDTRRLKTLQAIVLYEMGTAPDANKKPNKMGRATEALLWLKRGLQFLERFLHEVIATEAASATHDTADAAAAHAKSTGDGKDDLVSCAQRSYSLTLKPHHNAIARGAFHLAVRAIPYKSEFIRTLAPTPEVASDAAFFDCVIEDMRDFSRGLQLALISVQSLYEHYRLESALQPALSATYLAMSKEASTTSFSLLAAGSNGSGSSLSVHAERNTRVLPRLPHSKSST